MGVNQDIKQARKKIIWPRSHPGEKKRLHMTLYNTLRCSTHSTTQFSIKLDAFSVGHSQLIIIKVCLQLCPISTELKQTGHIRKKTYVFKHYQNDVRNTPSKCQLIHPCIASSTLRSFLNARSSESKQQNMTHQTTGGHHSKQSRSPPLTPSWRQQTARPRAEGQVYFWPGHSPPHRRGKLPPLNSRQLKHTHRPFQLKPNATHISL